MSKDSFLHKVFDLYYDGFRSMRLGKTLWAIILIKLFIEGVLLSQFPERARSGQRVRLCSHRAR